MRIVQSSTVDAPVSLTSTEHSLSEFDDVFTSKIVATFPLDVTATEISPRPISATTQMATVEMFHATLLRCVRRGEIASIIQRERKALTPEVENQEE
jgi:hypothetical protein